MELIIFILMVAAFMIGCFKLKLPVSLSLVISSILGLLVSGNGLSIRHLVEGTFGYIDAILIIATAMIFMKVVQESGALTAISNGIIKKFHKQPAILLILLMFIVMFPGMITGSSTAAVLTAGSLVAPVLILMGIPKASAAAIIAMGGMMGMIAPPVNVPVMIIGGGVDMPYVGFTLPLFFMTIPIAIFSVLFLGYKHVKANDFDKLMQEMNFKRKDNKGILIYLPILVVIVLMIGGKIFPKAIPNLGMPLIFLLASLVGIFTGEKVNYFKSSKEAIRDALPVLGILMGVGMFIQVMTLTGVRGLIVVSGLSLPTILLYISIAITIPLFGAVSSYGSASVLGVPFLLALLARDQIITASALSLIASTGDLMPPTALAGLFAAQVVGEKDYKLVLKKCVVPAIVTVVFGLLSIVFANVLKTFLVL
ncbi:TRAP transporter large permease subunit [Natronincola ferrireducens]|uniref:TRAP-type C4-dicarboxylate transport system, large permease component n=1 Tax=Natronincola ferrireducens TaxID=393762 RepID=A0A1G9FRY7_9FIRM|nr:TRAP transporter large permease subunit [Natronincola ferrireducens]SDK91102.1 TRAP-type C4-dicarboxylate transport system, large permease component [Natronincola ferrireducens]